MTRKGAKGSEIGVGVRTSQGIANMFSVERQFCLDAGKWTWEAEQRSLTGVRVTSGADASTRKSDEKMWELEVHLTDCKHGRERRRAQELNIAEQTGKLKEDWSVDWMLATNLPQQKDYRMNIVNEINTSMNNKTKRQSNSYFLPSERHYFHSINPSWFKSENSTTLTFFDT